MFPLVKIYRESLGLEEVQQKIYQYVVRSADTKVLLGFMHPAHKYMVGTRLSQAKQSRHGLDWLVDWVWWVQAHSVTQ